MFKSAFSGQIDEIPGISVDNFENPEKVRARAYFLSHCHSDHTQGLYSRALIEVLEETGTCLYMSESSAAIVDDENTDPRIMKYVKPLKLGTNSITLPSRPEDDLEEMHITVSVIPAGHSFGSVMFLFKVERKTILFTGDFRISPSDLPKYGHFHNGMDPITIDVMYVDTTFMGYRYLNFPKRTESMENLIEIIKKHLRNEKGRIALHMSARYGYEFVYNEIYDKLKMNVNVGPRWNFYKKVLHLVLGVTIDEVSTKIHLCRNMSEKKDHTKCLNYLQGDENFLYIHFSAMKWDGYKIETNPCNQVSDNRVDVCFATHCSRSELMYFVNYFSPKKVVGFPEDFVQEKTDNNNCVDEFEISCKKRKTSPKNEKINRRDAKVDKHLLKQMFSI